MAQIAKAAKAIARRQAQAGPWQVRVVDGEGSPQDEHDPAQKPDARDQPGRKLIQKAAVCAQSFPPVVATAKRPGLALQFDHLGLHRR